MKRVNGDGIAMLLDLDDCLGCFGMDAGDGCVETTQTIAQGSGSTLAV